VDMQDIRETMMAEDTAVSLAEVFKALGDPTRIKMMDVLRRGEICVQDLAMVLDMGQSAVSHQLRYLRNLRIVKRRKSGKAVFYSLDDTHIEQIFVQMLQHITHS
jgi:ArsR family transcriptional regulator, lead/cadmium/zinc/bismuth-responsive transcriptional repressor